ncbi:hypothetical protein EDD21DRAFT_51875 [Dissophora ornata]|nr:hypothetical protein EDD21DRAFT_51875 [Dissophora ornata]
MHPSTAISAPSTPAPAAPRAQRSNNRKSGSQAQSQSQSQSQNQNQNRHHPNTNGNGTRQAQKPLEHQNRHQSMPAQQRGPANNNNNNNNKADNSNVTILKRASATAAPKASSPVPVMTQDSTKKPTVSTSLQPLQPLSQKQQQQQQQQRNHYSNQKQKPQPQQQPPSKARRVQRRKEIESATESLAHADLDLALHQSPPLDPSSPPSSSDSDDSESALSRLPDNYLTSKRSRKLAGTPPQRPSSTPVVPQPHRGYHNMDAVHTSSHHGPAFANRASHPLDMFLRPSTAPVKAASVDKAIFADRSTVEKKSPLYAGPTFHNSPAPTCLPIPAFARSAGNSPAEPAVERLPSVPFFGEAASPQLNSMRPQMFTMQSSAPAWPAHYSMPMGQSYNVPERMATSNYTPHMVGQHGTDQLMEISQNLRTLLKIQSQ